MKVRSNKAAIRADWLLYLPHVPYFRPEKELPPSIHPLIPFQRRKLQPFISDANTSRTLEFRHYLQFLQRQTYVPRQRLKELVHT